MLTKTSLLGIRILLLLGQSSPRTCLPPRQLAAALGESPTYLSKVCRMLVRSGILRAQKGIKGGVWLNRQPSEVTLLAVVEACQGAIAGDYCNGAIDSADVCAFHKAALELYKAVKSVLERWTLADLLARPHPVGQATEAAACVMLARRVSSQPPAPFATLTELG